MPLASRPAMIRGKMRSFACRPVVYVRNWANTIEPRAKTTPFCWSCRRGISGGGGNRGPPISMERSRTRARHSAGAALASLHGRALCCTVAAGLLERLLGDSALERGKKPTRSDRMDARHAGALESIPLFSPTSGNCDSGSCSSVSKARTYFSARYRCGVRRGRRLLLPKCQRSTGYSGNPPIQASFNFTPTGELYSSFLVGKLLGMRRQGWFAYQFSTGAERLACRRGRRSADSEAAQTLAVAASSGRRGGICGKMSVPFPSGGRISDYRRSAEKRMNQAPAWRAVTGCSSRVQAGRRTLNQRSKLRQARGAMPALANVYAFIRRRCRYPPQPDTPAMQQNWIATNGFT